MPRYALGLLFGAGLFAAGCLVSSFEKVDDVPSGGTGGTNTGGGGTGGGTGATGGSGNVSGTGGASACDSCSAGPNGEPACCFKRPDDSEVCGLEILEYGNKCLPLGGQGAAVDVSICNVTTAAGLDLPGCCMPSGICGQLEPGDPRGLGCMPAEAFGAAPVPCGGANCGRYCTSAQSATCEFYDTSYPYPMYGCGELCLALGCNVELAALIADPCVFAGICSADGQPIYTNCVGPNFEFSKCTGDIDCVRYCEMVVDDCSGSPQFTNPDQCVKFCTDWEATGLLGDTNVSDVGAENTIWCRMDRARQGDCAAAGPAGQTTSGVGQCGGGAIQSYCLLYESRCPTQYATEFPSADVCLQSGLTASGTFNYGFNTGNTVECRIQQLLEGKCAEAAKSPATGPCL